MKQTSLEPILSDSGPSWYVRLDPHEFDFLCFCDQCCRYAIAHGSHSTAMASWVRAINNAKAQSDVIVLPSDGGDSCRPAVSNQAMKPT